MRTVPAGGERHLRGTFCSGTLLTLALRYRDDVDPIFSEAKRRLDCFSQSAAGLIGNGDAILDDLDTRSEPLDLLVPIDAHDFSIEKNPEISLLLQKSEKLAHLGLCRDGDPECNEDRFPTLGIDDVRRDRRSRFRADFPA